MVPCKRYPNPISTWWPLPGHHRCIVFVIAEYSRRTALTWAESSVLCCSLISCLLGPSTSSSGFYYSNLCLTSVPWNVARIPSSSLSVCGSHCPSARLSFHSGDKSHHFLHSCLKLGILLASYFLASLLICFHLQDVLHGL